MILRLMHLKLSTLNLLYDNFECKPHLISNIIECYHVSSICSRSITKKNYNDVIMGAIASQITSLTIVYSTVYSDAD